MHTRQPDFTEQLQQSANDLHRSLVDSDNNLVLAESCTAGLIAASLGRIPGVSSRLAGSFVVYQIASKIAWLGIDADLIRQHGVVSEAVARDMATGALHQTPHASIALAITGHLGPNAPPDQDGTAWIALTRRTGHPRTALLQLQPSAHTPFPELRWLRQQQAATIAMQIITNWIAKEQPSPR
ncbi:MAG: Nicotinamide-nucleotide amidohydrolase PncC [Planctomycetota bacterium]